MRIAAHGNMKGFMGHEKQGNSKPRPFKSEMVGHPQQPSQFLGVDVLEWYHPLVRVREEKKNERVARPAEE